ncbi:hypothetical protein FB451DRAFT_1565960 [Mycena latifolia]|nr:hypothetical protein FB451DRAFT_1565960 [Mycena latifolia]
MPLDAINAAMMRILRTPLPDALLARIEGSAPNEVKAWAVKWMQIYHAPPRCFVGALTRGTVVSKVEFGAGPLGDKGEEREGEGAGRVLTMVCEAEVTEGCLNAQAQLATAWIVTVIDECVSAAVAALDYARGGPGMSGVSLSLNTTFHAPVELGARLRFVNTTHAVSAQATACRCEVWDLTQKRLVATAVFAGMPSSLPKSASQIQPRAARL